MNIRSLILALCAFIAFSFTGKAFDLPFGDANMREYGATNIGVVAVQFVQFDPESGAETVYMDSQLGIRFQSYTQFINYVHNTMLINEWRLNDLVFPDENLVIYIAGAWGDFYGGTYYGFSDFERIKLIQTSQGWKFPIGFVDEFEPEISIWPVFQFGKPVKWAKIVALDSETYAVRRLQDLRIDNSPFKEIWLDGASNIHIRRDYVLNDPGLKIYLTIGFEDGTTQAWGGDGKEIPVPTPTLSLTSSVDEGLVLVLNHGNIRNTVSIECSGDLKSWTNFQTFVTTQYVTRISITESSNPPSCFFRIAE